MARNDDSQGPPREGGNPLWQRALLFVVVVCGLIAWHTSRSEGFSARDARNEMRAFRDEACACGVEALGITDPPCARDVAERLEAYVRSIEGEKASPEAIHEVEAQIVGAEICIARHLPLEDITRIRFQR
ncbi:MAG: hypothetical protein AAF721_04070 [Myxococcota bacterium]